MPAEQQQQVIFFGPNQESGYEELGGASPLAMNVIVDKNGTVSKRPGIVADSSIMPTGVVDSDGILGLYESNDRQIFAVGNGNTSRNIYKLVAGSSSNLSTTANSGITGTGRPVFTETEVFLIATGGQEIQKVRLSNNESSRLGGNPPRSSHVAANSSRLVANDSLLDKTKVRFSGISQGTVDTSGHETWDVTGLVEDGGFFTAEARPDPVVAVYENTNEIFVFGQNNVQVFTPGSDPVFTPSSTREFGLVAPYSVIRKDQEFIWLDHNRRFVYSDGRSFQTIEKPIKKQLDSMDTVSDCFGYRVLLGHIDCFVWTFPSDGRTFAYQIDGGWSQWSGFDISKANFKVIPILSHHLTRTGGKNLVGTTSGKVGILSQDANTDLGDLIVSRTSSGFIDRGTDNRKRCISVKVAIRRGQSSTRSFGTLEWRDNLGEYGNPIQIDFGVTGDDYVVKEYRSLGTYRRRDWRFTFSDDAKLSLVKVTETFQTLGI